MYANPDEIPAPPTLPRAQQETARAALRILDERRAVLLSEATGTGKTYIACAMIADNAARGAGAAVIAPAHLREMWRAVLRCFGIRARVHSFHAASAGRIPQADATDILWVVDEAHMLKNPASRRYVAVSALTAREACGISTGA